MSTPTTRCPPVLLSDLMPEVGRGLARFGRLVGYPHHWQMPAATEMAAFAGMQSDITSIDYAYLGAPWATVIDGVRGGASEAFEVLAALKACRRALPRGLRVATVAQHIHADRFAGLFRACGVTDLFWSHARVGRDRLDGMIVHPFPLFPAQTPDGPDPADPHRPRRWLANFIGAYNPKVYLTDVRARIFADAGVPDMRIVRREAWHFERAVYREQIGGVAGDAARLAIEASEREEYLDAIRDSEFTLCPSGSGPNSIRIGEALALASIPIILTRDLALPGDVANWEAACLFEEDSAEGYLRALARARAMSPAELRDRQLATRTLFAMISKSGYAKLITASMAASARY